MTSIESKSNTRGSTIKEASNQPPPAPTFLTHSLEKWAHLSQQTEAKILIDSMPLKIFGQILENEHFQNNDNDC